jgi:RHS repeat-associated protein
VVETGRSCNGLNQDAAIAGLTTACTSDGAGFDCNGNLAKDYYSTRTFIYDVQNRLISVTSPTKIIDLTYDPEGRLYEYTVNGAVTYFGYDGTNLVAEYGETGVNAKPLRQYVHGTGVDEPVVWFEHGVTSTNNPFTDKRYFVKNYQGSIIGYANASGVLQELYTYGPWGEPKSEAGGIANYSWSGSRFRYTGQTMLGDAELYYYKARVYDPISGRFLQTDPIGSKDDLDLYAYVAGDPVNKSDPTGTRDKPCDLGCQVRVGTDRYVRGSNEVANNFAHAVADPQIGNANAMSNIAQGKGTQGDVETVVTNTVLVGTAVLTEGASTAGRLGAAGEAGSAGASTRGAIKEGIYQFSDQNARGVTYVGQSGNIPNRLAQHEAAGRLATGTATTQKC